MNLVRKKVKNKGFTLIELIMSIGIIAVISGIVLQLFITAGNLNKKAEDIDRCVMLSQTLIQDFKSTETLSDFLRSASLKSSKANSPQNRFFVYYDDNWNVINNIDNTSKVCYKFEIRVDNNIVNSLSTIKIRVIKKKYRYLEKDNGKDFYDIEAAKYVKTNKVSLSQDKYYKISGAVPRIVYSIAKGGLMNYEI